MKIQRLCWLMLLCSSALLADSPCSTTGDMGTSTDPRVPPAGTYTTKNADGSTTTTYTTGDKKPYYVDNPCQQNTNNNNTNPQVYVLPPTKR